MSKSTILSRYRAAGILILTSVVICGFVVSLASRVEAVRSTGTCPTVNVTPNISYAYGYVTLNGLDAPVGTIIEARSPSGVVAGCATVDTAGVYASMPIYGTDTTVTPVIPGMGAGEVVKFYVNGIATSSSPTLTWSPDRASHLVSLSAVSATPTVTPTITPTVTVRPTVTPSPTVRSTVTPTPTVTTTPAPTPTPITIPTNTLAPLIIHTPPGAMIAGAPLMISAIVTDDVAVQSVKLYYRRTGASSYVSQTMSLSTGSLYSATISGANIVTPSLQYYILASDGANTSWAGWPDAPYQINVIDRPILTAITPDHGPVGGGASVTIQGANFKPGASVKFDTLAALSVTVNSSRLITCTTPAHYPMVVDVTVTNPDGQSGTALKTYGFQGTSAQLSLPSSSGAQHTFVQVPLNATVAGLVAADIVISFDSSVIQARAVHPGSLTGAWTIIANTTAANQVWLSLISPGGAISGTGNIAVIEFEVVGGSGASTPMHVSSANLNDGAIVVQTTDGAFTVQSLSLVMGAVRYWNANTAITNTLLSLAGGRSYTAFSDPTGAYTVTGVYPGAYTLTPSKSDGAAGITGL